MAAYIIIQGIVAHSILHRLQIREAVGDMDVCGMRVPKGTWIHVAVCAIQRDPNVWREPVRWMAHMHAMCASTLGTMQHMVGLFVMYAVDFLR